MTWWDTSFFESILAEELSRHFQALQIREYMRTTDPKDHLCYFENVSVLHQYSEGVKFWVFLMTLARLAHRWFNHLKSRSISSFEEFSTLFLHHFTSSKHYHKTPSVSSRWRSKVRRLYKNTFRASIVPPRGAFGNLRDLVECLLLGASGRRFSNNWLKILHLVMMIFLEGQRSISIWKKHREHERMILTWCDLEWVSQRQRGGPSPDL